MNNIKYLKHNLQCRYLLYILDFHLNLCKYAVTVCQPQ